jgi:hypothetical protein
MTKQKVKEKIFIARNTAERIWLSVATCVVNTACWIAAPCKNFQITP